MDLDIRFTPVSQEDYKAWTDGVGHDRHIITLLGRSLTAEMIASVTNMVNDQNWNIASIQRISPRGSPAPESQLVAVEFRINHQNGNKDTLREACLSLSTQLDVDIAIQEDNLWRTNRRLVCFDMDSTLIQSEVIDLMAEAAGVGEQVSSITASAMRGEIDFSTSFEKRLGLLKGLPESELEKIDQSLAITDGAERLLGNLNRLGFTTAILSGGFTWFAEKLAKRLSIDHVHANELEIENGKLTGRVIGKVVNETRKAELLRTIAQQEGIRLEQVIAVGDGANDIPMLTIAGLGIAFHAKPAVRESADTALGTVGLDGILYLIGMREFDIANSP